MRRRINRTVLHRGASRIFPQEIVAIPIRRRPDRPWREPAAAVGTDIAENLFDARLTERALIRTDPRLKRIRRQRLVTMFASWPKFEHGTLPVELSTQDDNRLLEPSSSVGC